MCFHAARDFSFESQRQILEMSAPSLLRSALERSVVQRMDPFLPAHLHGMQPHLVHKLGCPSPLYRLRSGATGSRYFLPCTARGLFLSSLM